MRTDLYVRQAAANASDTNAGTAAQPLETLDRAIELANGLRATGDDVVIHLGPHTNAGYVWTETIVGPPLGDGLFVIIGDGATDPAGGFTEVASFTAEPFSSKAGVVVPAPALTPDAYLGLTIEVVTGAAAGDRRLVRNNTANTIVPVSAFTAPIAPGDTVRIVKPSITVLAPGFSAPGGTLTLARNLGGYVPNFVRNNETPSSGHLYLMQLDFSVQLIDPAIPYAFAYLENTSLVVAGVQHRSVILASDMKSGAMYGMDTDEVETFEPGPDGIKGAFELALSPSVKAWRGWGVHFTPAVPNQAFSGGIHTPNQVGYLCSSKQVLQIERTTIRVHGGGFHHVAIEPAIDTREARWLVGQAADIDDPNIYVYSEDHTPDKAANNGAVVVRSGTRFTLDRIEVTRVGDGVGVLSLTVGDDRGALTSYVDLTGVTSITAPRHLIAAVIDRKSTRLNSSH